MKKAMSNHIGEATFPASILVAKFTQASGDPRKVGLSDLCRWDQHGNATADDKVVFPYFFLFF